MPQLPPYTYTGPLDCSFNAEQNLDLGILKGKSVIVTGGAGGIGEAYSRGFLEAGAYVTIGDVDVEAGEKLAAEFPGNSQFIRCDVTKWEDQLAMFKQAISNSPHKSCDIVIANAGVATSDPLYPETESVDEPTKPSLSILEINLLGNVYTTRLALFYFKKQPDDAPARDRCLVIQGSLAGYIDQPGTPLYNASKYGQRGLWRSLRRTEWRNGVRVNYISPWYIHTKIISDKVRDGLENGGVMFAELGDAKRAVLRIAADQTVHGHSLTIIPRIWEQNGYKDIEHDHYPEGDEVLVWEKACIHAIEGIL